MQAAGKPGRDDPLRPMALDQCFGRIGSRGATRPRANQCRGPAPQPTFEDREAVTSGRDLPVEPILQATRLDTQREDDPHMTRRRLLPRVRVGRFFGSLAKLFPGCLDDRVADLLLCGISKQVAKQVAEHHGLHSWDGQG